MREERKDTMRVAVLEYALREYILNVFSRHPAVELACFLEHRPQEDVYKGIPVRPLSSLDGGGAAQYDAVLAAVPSDVVNTMLVLQMHDYGVRNLYFLRRYFMGRQEDFLTDSGFHPEKVDAASFDKPYIPHIEAHVCDHCNLNCKACDHFSPFVREKWTVDMAQFRRDMARLTELADVARFLALGGEPLLEPELCMELVRIGRRILPRAEIHVLTNCTLMLKMKPEFWQTLREHSVILDMSLYPPVADKLQEFLDLLEQYGVEYNLNRVTTFFKRLTLYPFEDTALNNARCASRSCHFLRDGCLYKCPDAYLIGYMAESIGTVPEALRERDFVRLADVTDPWAMVRKLEGPCELCRRCTIDRQENIPWQSAGASPDPVDWLLEDRLSVENKLLWEYNGVLEKEVERLKTAAGEG